MSTKRKIRKTKAAENAVVDVGITPDPDNPEWTPAGFARAERAAEMLKPKRGRPKSTSPKVHVNLRLDAEIVEQFRATGRGWQTRLNAALKEWLKTRSRS